MKTRKKTVAVIPARGGSKGIPRKNLCMLGGKPLIAYAIEIGLKSPGIDRVIVSTDDAEIAQTAKKYGAEVPFMRPADIAMDNSPDKDVFLHLINWLKKEENYDFDFLMNLRCTTPFKKMEHISRILEMVDDEDCDSVRTVTKVKGKCHPYWVVKLDSENHAIPFLDDIDIYKYHQRQLLPPAYFINGVVDVIKRDVILNSKTLYGSRMKILETDPLYAIDIDTIDDLHLCEALLGVIK